jgi:hypothetical protein
MPDLVQLLRSQDLGHVQIVAELWGLELRPNELESGAEAAAALMQDARLAGEVIEALEPRARGALTALLQAGGRMPWATFARQFGDVREMGAGRRDREKPHLQPASAAEVLFYRALLGRAFFETGKGPQEFAYIPEDLLGLLRKGAPALGHLAEAPGRPVAPAEHSRLLAAGDRILDEATTLLAALRTEHTAADDPVLRELLEASGILKQGKPQAARVKAFLEMPRTEAMRLLVDSWRTSEAFDELRLMPGLICEGAWVNRPRATREFLLGQLRSVPRTAWWSLPSFVGHIKQKYTDFQRPPGDFDSWFIKSAADGGYLRGFSSWDQVDGALIRFLISGVMHRLGLIDLGSAGSDSAPSAFRLAHAARPATTEDGKLHVSSQARIAASAQVPRAVRYQLSRFCEWEEPKAEEYRYHVTPASLTRAAKQGLKVEHLLALLARHAEAGIPAPVTKALKRWAQAGTEARTESQVVLRVSRPEIIKELRASRAARFLGQPLGPTAIIIKPGAQGRVIAALAEMGILALDESVQVIGAEEGAGGGQNAPRKSTTKVMPKK